jgi:hypothetical protein
MSGIYLKGVAAVPSGSFKLLKGKIASLFSQLSTWSFNFTLFRIPFFFFLLCQASTLESKMGNVD